MSKEEVNYDYGEAPVETQVLSANYGTIDQLVKIGEEIYKKIIDFSKEKRRELKPAQTQLQLPPPPVEIIPTKMDSSNDETTELDREMRKLERLNMIIQRRQNFRKRSKTREKVEKVDEDIDLEDTNYKEIVRKLQEEYKDFNISFPIFIRWTAQTGDFYPNALRKFLALHAATRLKDMEEFLRLQTKYAVYTYKEKYPHWDTAKVIKMSSDIMKALMKEDKEFKEVNEEVKKDMEADQKIRTEYMMSKLKEKFTALHNSN